MSGPRSHRPPWLRCAYAGDIGPETRNPPLQSAFPSRIRKSWPEGSGVTMHAHGECGVRLLMLNP